MYLIMPQFVEVALPVPMRRSYSYRLLPGLPPPRPGVRVRVPFGRQQLIGLVTAVTDSCTLAENQIKDIIELIDTEPALPEPLYKLTLWAARYYFCSQGQMLTQALPVALRKGADASPKSRIMLSLTDKAQEAGLAALKERPPSRNWPRCCLPPP